MSPSIFSMSLGSTGGSLSRSALGITSSATVWLVIMDITDCSFGAVAPSAMFTTFITSVGAFSPCPAYTVNACGNSLSYSAYSAPLYVSFFT